MTTCWIITEGIAGTENQCIGVAEALGVDPVIKRIQLRPFWNLFSPYFPFETASSFIPKLEPPWPNLVIASGRKAIAAARYIKKVNKGKTFTVFTQDPRISPRHFDLVARPAHDPTRGPNVIETIASPNRITQAKLDSARDEFEYLLTLRPTPRVAVMIGGNSKAYKMTAQNMKNLCAQLRALDEKGAGLMITASRRTGDENRKILEQELKGTNAYLWNGEGKNPYFGFLAWADYILVTADSASMLSEAGTTGKPVYMIPLEGGTKRIERMHKNLEKRGVMRIFEGKLENWSYEPLHDAALIADAIRKNMDI